MDKQRFLHSVVDTATLLAGYSIGSLSGGYQPDLPELRDWLAWRVEEGWEDSGLAMSVAYDYAVREMGRAAVAMYDKTYGNKG